MIVGLRGALRKRLHRLENSVEQDFRRPVTVLFDARAAAAARRTLHLPGLSLPSHRH